MTEQRPPGATARLPVLVVVDTDDEARHVTEEALTRRFTPDYRVVGAGSAEAGLAVLEELAAAGEDVALVAADLHLPGGGVEFLRQAHALHRGAGRVLLFSMDQFHTRIPFGELATLQHATALGRIDFQLAKGWVDPEEWFYPQVQDWLSGWIKAHRPHFVIYRVVGERWTPATHRLLELLTRNSVPFEFVAADSEQGRRLIASHGVDPTRLPAAVHQNGTVLVDPDLGDLAASHGIQTRPRPERYDLAILGAGPAGLAAALYGASEGLRTVVVEPVAIGGQAGTSSLIRNYLGFVRGISGGELAHRAWEQAVLLGAQFVFSQPAIAVTPGADAHVVHLADGGEVTARAVIVATGVTYRRLEIPALERLLGAGVYYGAAGVEAPAVAGRPVYVVGGANSAGQAAVHMAAHAARVTLVLRGTTLAAGMSDYLVRQVEATPTIDVRYRTRVSDARGETRLEGLTLEDLGTGRHADVPAAALFVLIGAAPHTGWLHGTLALDDQGYVLTSRDLPTAAWPLARPAWPFETSRPGVFAAGDVRHGSVKRVAGAVGEGSVAVGAVHEYLAHLVAAAAARSS